MKKHWAHCPCCSIRFAWTEVSVGGLYCSPQCAEVHSRPSPLDKCWRVCCGCRTVFLAVEPRHRFCTRECYRQTKGRTSPQRSTEKASHAQDFAPAKIAVNS